jgi:WD40 repeat protein
MSVESIAYVATFSPDGGTIASGSEDGSIQLWDVSDQSALGAPLTGHTAAINSLDFNPDGTKLLSGSGDHTLRLWPAPTRSPEAARDALCAKLTHNMSDEQWDNWVSPQIDYDEGCDGLPKADYAG